VATDKDLALAKRLLAAHVLTQDQLRTAFELLERVHAAGRGGTLEAALYHLELLPRGCLAILRAPGPLQAQPLANYRLEAVLGDGGSSTVYRARYVPNGTPVAVKVLDPVQALRPAFLERFQHEAKILIELEHDHIVQGYEVGFEGGLHYFSMDLVDGVTVLEVIERRGHLHNDEALSVTLQAAEALQYLHTSGYLHRDIKPGNIMVEASGHARLIDLGLVRGLPRAGEEVAGEAVTTVGTVEYLSPEQARGRADLDPRSDIYSLGVSLYHMVVGEVPFQGENDYETMAKQVLSALDTQKVKQRRITPEVHFFITKMTSKEREMRFETVPEVIRAVGAYVPEGIVPVDLGPPPAAPPVAAPVVAPVAPPVVRPAKPPRAPPVAKPVARPVAKPVARPVAKPIAKPVAKPIAKPVAKPVAKPLAKPAPPPAPKAPPPPSPKREEPGSGKEGGEGKPAAPVPTRRRRHLRRGGDGPKRPRRKGRG
jgi:serine/threonine protein kinase